MTGDKDPLRVVLFDDSPRHNRSLSSDLSEAGIAVVGVAETVQEMRELITTVPFDVAMLDIRVGSSEDDWTGLRMGLWLRIHRPDVGVLMFTNIDSEFCALRLLDVNPHGVGYLVKDRVHDTREIARAIALINEGLNVLDNGIRAALLPVRGRDRLGEDLTPTEMETLRLLAEGYTTDAIAEISNVKPVTINTRCSAIFRKLGIPHLDAPDKRNRRVTAVVHYIKNLEKYRRIREIAPVDWPSP